MTHEGVPSEADLRQETVRRLKKKRDTPGTYGRRPMTENEIRQEQERLRRG
jgi:hypothetical protein